MSICYVGWSHFFWVDVMKNPTIHIFFSATTLCTTIFCKLLIIEIVALLLKLQLPQDLHVRISSSLEESGWSINNICWRKPSVLTPLLCRHVIRYTYICDEESQTFQLHINEFEHLFLFMYVAIWLDFLFLCRGSEQKSVNFNFVFNLSFFIGDECLKCFVGVCYYSF